MYDMSLHKKLIFRFFILLPLFWILTPQSLLFAQSSEDEYLIKAFSNLKKNPPPQPTDLQQKIILQIKSEIESNAAKKSLYALKSEFIEKVGWVGFPAIAELLKSKEPWVRALAAQTLFALDRQRSIPFLIGLLSDKGIFEWMDDVGNLTVSTYANGLIRGAFHGTLNFITPVDDENTPYASVRALQNYFWFHLPYCEWRNKLCFIQLKNLITQLDKSRFPMQPNDDDYKGINFIFIGQPNKRFFKLGEPVNLLFGFLHYGNRIMWIRWDVRDSSIHKFKLIDPNGKELKLKPEGLPSLSDLVPVLQPQWSDGGGGGKELNLAEMFDIKQSGKYRFYYEYIPPKLREKDEQYRPLRLWSWDGKDYVNYYEFIIE